MELMNIRKYPTTLNLFPMPVENFLFTVQAIAHLYGWRKLHVIFDQHGDPSPFSALGRLDPNAPGLFSGHLKLTISQFACSNPALADFTESLKVAQDFRGRGGS